MGSCATTPGPLPTTFDDHEVGQRRLLQRLGSPSMAVMEPVSSLSQFLTVLTELRLGQRARYPFYCALLYTTAEGMDAALGRYVDRNWEELDAMTGETCLVFVLGDLRNEPAA